MQNSSRYSLFLWLQLVVCATGPALDVRQRVQHSAFPLRSLQTRRGRVTPCFPTALPSHRSEFKMNPRFRRKSPQTPWGSVHWKHCAVSRDRAFWLDKRHLMSDAIEFNSSGTSWAALPHRYSNHLFTPNPAGAASKPNSVVHRGGVGGIGWSLA